MKRRISLILVALLAVGGLAVVPATAAQAAGGTKTGTIKVQLAKINGDNFQKKGFVVEANGMTKNVYKQAKTNAQGIATLKVPQGKYKITVKPYYTDYRYAVNHKDYIAITRGQVKTIGLTMYKGAQITGKVMKPTGFALAGAEVAAVNKKGIVVGRTFADKKGKYRLAGLPTGKYAVIFNYRDYDDGKKKVISNYGWDFYKGNSIADARFIEVYQENKYAAATVESGISGPVDKGSVLSVKLTEKNSSAGRLLVDHISVKGKYLQLGSVYAPFAKGKTAKVRVEPGKYRLGVVYAGVSYYYTGDGVPLTKKVSKAVLSRFDGNALSVKFGPIP